MKQIFDCRFLNTAQHLSDEDITPSELDSQLQEFINQAKPFSDIWGLRLDKYHIHARFILLDTVTGCRSQYQQGAFCISV